MVTAAQQRAQFDSMVEAPMDATSSSSRGGGGGATTSPYQVNIKIMIAAIVVLFSVILFILSLHLYAKWFWKSSRFAARRRRLLHLQQIHAIQQQIQAATAAAAAGPGNGDHHHHFHHHHHTVFFSNSPALGLDKSIIQSLPLFVFRDSDKIKLDCCAVCLCEFQNGEQGRTLPKCGHSFHTECIDMWLHCHSTCPLCRASLLDSTAAAGSAKSILPELLLLPDVNLVSSTSFLPVPTSSSNSSPSSSSDDFVSSSSSPAASSSASLSASPSLSSTSSSSPDADQLQLQQQQQQLQLVQVVLDLDETKSTSQSSSSSSSSSSSVSAKGRWRNLRRMLRLPPSSSSLPASGFCSFSSTSSSSSTSAPPSYAVSVVGESPELQNSILLLVE